MTKKEVGKPQSYAAGVLPLLQPLSDSPFDPMHILPGSSANKKLLDAERFAGRESVPYYHESFPMQAQKQIEKRADKVASSPYNPIPSVWNGEDSELLERLLVFYPRKEPKRILDATVNGGRFWKGSERKIIGMDLVASHRPSLVGDNTSMPFGDGTLDVIVYDPPHIPNQGKDKRKDFNTRFGLGERSPKEHGYTFTHLYPPFMSEAYRTLIAEGVLFCKIADYVHHHQYQWAHVELIQAATSAGFRACDCIIKTRKKPIVDPRWKVAHHSRRQHSYWLIFRKSKKCE